MEMIERVAPVLDDPVNERDRTPDVIAAFCGLAGAFDTGHDVDGALRLVAQTITGLLGIRRCFVYLKDPGTELFRGRVAQTGDDEDERVRRLTCGTAGDLFTREILETARPVLVADARRDPRPVRAAMHAWGVRSMLGVPIIFGREVIGLMFLDDGNAAHDFTPDERGVAATFGELAGVALAHALRTEDLRCAMDATARQNKLLRHASVLDERLTQELVDAHGVAQIATALASVTGRYCAIYDASVVRLATGEPPTANGGALRPFDRRLDDLPEVRRALAAAEPRRHVVIDPIPAADLRYRLLVAPVYRGERAIGYVALCETGTRFTPADAAGARRAAMAVGIDFAFRRQASLDNARAREVLLRDLISGISDVAQTVARANFVGLALDQPCLLGLLQRRTACGPPLTVDEVAGACAARQMPHWAGAITAQDGSIVIVAPIDAGASRIAAIANAKHHLNTVALALSEDGEVLAALSTVCVGPKDFCRGFEEARQVLGCLERLGTGGTRASSLAADDLGASRLFLSASDPTEARRFVVDILGPLGDVTDAKAVDLLVTAQTFFDCGRSIRGTASTLKVHGNTVRYRLSRIEEITGKDIASDSAQQLDFHVALMILSLEHRVPRDIVARLN